MRQQYLSTSSVTAGDVILRCLLAALFCAVSGCGAGRQAPKEAGRGDATGEKPVVAVVNYPLKYFAQRIGGDLVEVRFPVPSDVDPAFWKPDAEAIGQYQEADLILLNGADYAHWTRHAALPSRRIVNTSQAAADRYIEVEDSVIHRHGPSGEHSHAGLAFTTWLDLSIAAEQVDAVHDALRERLPEHAEALGRNRDELRAELIELDVQLMDVARAVGRQPLLASHPVYQYFSRRYGLNVRSLHWEPEEMPDEESWTGLRELRKEHAAEWMIWEGPPTAEIERRLAEMDVRCVVYLPCGNEPEAGDFLSIMKSNIAAMNNAFATSVDRVE